MRNITIFLFALTAVYLSCEAKYFATRCDLVDTLRQQGFPEDKMQDWVCLIEKQSERKTHKIGSVGKDGSRDFGLFQINEKYWCTNTGIPGKECNVTCVDLLSDDITKAATCAKMIFERHNFLAWYGWRNQCLGQTLPDISNC